MKWLVTLGVILLAIAGVLALAYNVIGLNQPTSTATEHPSSYVIPSPPIPTAPAVTPTPEALAPTPDNPVDECVVIPGVETCKDPYPKDTASMDPYPQGNAPIGGGANANPGPGQYIAPECVQLPPSTPYVAPEPPAPSNPVSDIIEWLGSTFSAPYIALPSESNC